MSDQVREALFEEAMKKNRGRFAAISRSYAGGESDDLLQEILLQIWKSLGKFESRSELGTWCYRVALNTALTWARTQGRRKKNLPREDSDVHSFSAADGGPAMTELLDRFLASINESERAVVLLYLDGLSSEQMSEVLGISEAAVRVRVHRVKTKLADWSGEDS